MTYAYLPDALIDAWPKLSPSAKAVAVALASFMNGKGECWPGRESIGRRAGIARVKTITGAVRKLTEAKLICVRRRRRDFCLFSWSLEGAKSATSKTLEGALSARLEGALFAPLIVNNTSERTTSSRHASHAGAKAKRRASRKTPGPPVWGWWVDANREAGQPDPVRTGPDLGGARDLGKAVTRGELTESELRGCMALYLADDDTWLGKQGHALRHLAGRIGAYRARAKELEPPPMDPAEIDRIEAEAAEQDRRVAEERRARAERVKE